MGSVPTSDEILAVANSLLQYCPDNGKFLWKKTGKLAGTVCPRGYNRINIKLGARKHQVLAHRLAFYYANGRPPNGEIDHINGNPEDNRLENLREASREINGKNQKVHRTNTSGYTGVCWHKTKKRWTARGATGGKTVHLGYFSDPITAASVAHKWRAERQYTSRHIAATGETQCQALHPSICSL